MRKFYVWKRSDQYVNAVNGLWWYDHPLPKRWHRCKVYTYGYYDRVLINGYMDQNLVERCACGAIRYGHGRHWFDRNSRRKEEAK